MKDSTPYQLLDPKFKYSVIYVLKLTI